MHVISKFNACTTITWDGVEVVEEVAVHAQRQGARRGEEEGRECSRHVDFLRVEKYFQRVGALFWRPSMC